MTMPPIAYRPLAREQTDAAAAVLGRAMVGEVPVLGVDTWLMRRAPR